MHRLERAWHRKSPWLNALRPLAALFGLLAARRRRRYAAGRRAVHRPPVPVVVVGNINVGGTGKTPLVIALARLLAASGYRPGIVSRGYGARAPGAPRLVSPEAGAAEAGDEPLLLARRTGLPVAVGADRPAAADLLLAHHPCDLLLSDDGLQHYALARDVEIAVLDGARGLGNGLLLPAGPLREGSARLKEVDFVISNGPLRDARVDALGLKVWTMSLRPLRLCNLETGESRPLPAPGSESRAVHAVAGIGNPQRFFDSLSALGFAIIGHAFDDHHRFRPGDLAFDDGREIIMTEKDAVKCRDFATARCWYLEVEAVLPDPFERELLYSLRKL